MAKTLSNLVILVMLITAAYLAAARFAPAKYKDESTTTAIKYIQRLS